MSVTSPGSWVADDRRRRRLAVSGDAAGADPSAAEDETPSAVAVLRERVSELPSASPWLPVQTWKCAAIAAGFWTALVVSAVFAARPALLSLVGLDVLQPMMNGADPRLIPFLQVVLWLLAAEFAAIVGWYRSHSQLDFSGSYRVWGWVAFVLGAAGLLAGTGLHRILADAAVARMTWLQWRPDIVAWLTPLTLVGTVTFWLIDRDIRRCRGAVILNRLAAAVWFIVAGGQLLAPDLGCEAWYAPAMICGPLLAGGLMVTGLWRQACFVAYVCPDPPEKQEAKSWLAAGREFGSALLNRWWKPAPSEEESTDAAPKKPRRRKKADSESDEEAATPKRRRKSTAKPRRTTKSRTRTKPAAEPAPDEEESDDSSDLSAAENENDSSWDDSEEATEETSTTSQWSDDEEDLEQLEALTRPDAGASANSRKDTYQDESADWNNDGDDDEYGGVDEPHGQSEMFKGLSKRQRRELKKKLREQDRQQSRR